LVSAKVANGNKLGTLIATADAYSKKKNYIMSAKLYSQAIRISPGNSDLYYLRAFSWGKSGNYGFAIKDFTYVINQDRAERKSRYPHAPRFRADCYVAIKAMPQAVKDYHDFLRRESKDGKVWSYLAEAYYLMGRSDLALKAIAKGITTGSHWEGKLKEMRTKILLGKKILPHKPLSN